eukprot:364092-Chlamydomonas_euryale.AAC.8
MHACACARGHEQRGAAAPTERCRARRRRTWRDGGPGAGWVLGRTTGKGGERGGAGCPRLHAVGSCPPWQRFALNDRYVTP